MTKTGALLGIPTLGGADPRSLEPWKPSRGQETPYWSPSHHPRTSPAGPRDPSYFLKVIWSNFDILICKLCKFSGSHCGNGSKLVATWCQDNEEVITLYYIGASRSCGSWWGECWCWDTAKPQEHAAAAPASGDSWPQCREWPLSWCHSGRGLPRLTSSSWLRTLTRSAKLLEMAPRQGHKLIRSTHSITALFTKLLSHQYPDTIRPLDLLIGEYSSFKFIGKNLWRNFMFIWLTIDIISFQAIFHSPQKQDHDQMYYFYCLLDYNIILYRYFYLINGYTT